MPKKKPTYEELAEKVTLLKKEIKKSVVAFQNNTE
ncbi:MAG: hypothetical protein H6Q52_392 [Deltaproteobacteria bacterium]|nr:hypothetical protein [Deltaproteobacteria bacterium]